MLSENTNQEDLTKEGAMVSYFWKGLALFLLGVLIGIICSPVKNGVSIGNNNNIVNDERKTDKGDDDCCCDDE